jgi:putative two-component system response regulator
MFPAGTSVLLVDDDDDARFLMCLVLRRRGFTVDAVDSASSCLEYLGTHPVSIVVTDVEMPGMSGIELCRVIHEKYPDVVAIIMSGQTGPATIDAALRTGAFTFLPKPVSMAKLEATLRRVNESRPEPAAARS